MSRLNQHRAISVLKRDLRREEQKKEEEERRMAAEATKIQPLTEQMEGVATLPTGAESAQPKSSSTVRTLLSRRPSTISISSLHRPQFPLKLDLSSIPLKFTEEDATLIKKELGSPVTLAPKSARLFGVNEPHPELITAFSNTPMSTDGHGPQTIGLTIADGIHISQERTSMPLGLGDSSDKPIELDLDSMDIEMANMTDLFGDAVDSGNADNVVEGLFSPLGQSEDETFENPDDLPTEENVLADFQIDSNVNVELFGEFTASASLGRSNETNDSGGVHVDPTGSLLAQFSSSHLVGDKTSPSGNLDLSTTSSETFDLNSIDLSNLESEFFTNGQEPANFAMDMESFINMSTSSSETMA